MRHTFLFFCCFAACQAPEPAQIEGEPNHGGKTDDIQFGSGNLRIVASNLTSGPHQSYDPQHGERILLGLAPDIVLIQEFNYGNNNDPELRSWVDQTFGPEFSFFRETNSSIANGVISRFPILSAGTWNDPFINNRDFVWAQIDIPGDTDLWAVSLHLKASVASRRTSEANELLSLIQSNIPEEDFLVLGGDLNTNSHSENALNILGEVVNTNAPWPADQEGNTGTNSSRKKPYDQVLVDLDLDAFQIPVDLGENVFPAGAVIDTRTYTPLSDIAPALHGDSGSSNMQHMAVVKDFLIGGTSNGGGGCQASAEVCNGTDDDCDGSIDEGLNCESPDDDWEGINESGTVDAKEEHRFALPVLPAGEYKVALSGNNDADLYVRVGAAPTLEDFDCRPYLSGSNEECMVELDSNAPVHVMIRGWADDSEYTLQGVPVGGIDSEGPQQLSFAHTVDLAIPDNAPQGVTDTMTINELGTVVNLRVNLDITHTYQADLQVTLRRNGQAVLLHNNTGGGADDLVLDVELPQFSGATLAGDYQLEVIDSAGSDVGVFNTWGLTATLQ